MCGLYWREVGRGRRLLFLCEWEDKLCESVFVVAGLVCVLWWFVVFEGIDAECR